MVAGHYKADHESVFKSTTMDKTVLSAQDLLEASIELGIRILESGFEPTMIIAIWRGGTPVGVAVQETLAYCGIKSDHIAIRTSSYTGVDERGHVAVHGHAHRCAAAPDRDHDRRAESVLDDLRAEAK